MDTFGLESQINPVSPLNLGVRPHLKMEVFYKNIILAFHFRGILPGLKPVFSE